MCSPRDQIKRNTIVGFAGGLVKDNCCFLSHIIQFNASFLLRINFCFTKRKTPENFVICCCCVRSLTIVISAARVGPSKCAKSSRAAPARISPTDGQLPFRRTMTSLRISLVSDFFVFSLYKNRNLVQTVNDLQNRLILHDYLVPYVFVLTGMSQ